MNLKGCIEDSEVGTICGSFGISPAYYMDCSPPGFAGKSQVLWQIWINNILFCVNGYKIQFCFVLPCCVYSVHPQNACSHSMSMLYILCWMCAGEELLQMKHSDRRKSMFIVAFSLFSHISQSTYNTCDWVLNSQSECCIITIRNL